MFCSQIHRLARQLQAPFRRRRPARRSHSPRGGIELITPTLISGWVFHEQVAFVSVQLISGWRLLASAPINTERPDVAVHLNRGGLFGFQLAIPFSCLSPLPSELLRLEATSADGSLHVPLILIGGDAQDTEQRLRLALQPQYRGLCGHFEGLSADGLALQGWCDSHVPMNVSVWLQVNGLPALRASCNMHRPGMAEAGHNEHCGFVIPLRDCPDAAGRLVGVSFDETGYLLLPPGLPFRLPAGQAVPISAESSRQMEPQQQRQQCPDHRNLTSYIVPSDVPMELKMGWQRLVEMRDLLDLLEPMVHNADVGSKLRNPLLVWFERLRGRQ